MNRSPGLVRVVLDLLRAQREGVLGLSRRQERRLAALVALARSESGYYGRLYQGLPAGRVDLTDLPPVTKPELMAAFDKWATDPAVTRAGVESFMADPARIGTPYLGQCWVCSTSGTTGHPGLFVHDRGACTVYEAINYRIDLAWFSPRDWWGLFRRRLHWASDQQGSVRFSRSMAGTCWPTRAPVRSTSIRCRSTRPCSGLSCSSSGAASTWSSPDSLDSPNPGAGSPSPGSAVMDVSTLLGWYYSIIVAIVLTGLTMENWPWRLAGSRGRVALASLVGNVLLGIVLYYALRPVSKLLIGSDTESVLGIAINQFPSQLGVCWVAWMIVWANAFDNKPTDLGAAANLVARTAITFGLAVGTFALYYYVLAERLLHEPAVAGNLNGNALGFMDWFALVTLLYVVGFESYPLRKPAIAAAHDRPTSSEHLPTTQPTLEGVTS